MSDPLSNNEQKIENPNAGLPRDEKSLPDKPNVLDNEQKIENPDAGLPRDEKSLPDKPNIPNDEQKIENPDVGLPRDEKSLPDKPNIPNDEQKIGEKGEYLALNEQEDITPAFLLEKHPDLLNLLIKSGVVSDKISMGQSEDLTGAIYDYAVQHELDLRVSSGALELDIKILNNSLQIIRDQQIKKSLAEGLSQPRQNPSALAEYREQKSQERLKLFQEGRNFNPGGSP